MKESYQPIRNIEDAFDFLSQRGGKIEFREMSEIFNDGIVTRVRIVGVGDRVLQNERAETRTAIDCASFSIFTETIIRLAEEIRREDAASPVEFERPDVNPR